MIRPPPCRPNPCSLEQGVPVTQVEASWTSIRRVRTSVQETIDIAYETAPMSEVLLRAIVHQKGLIAGMRGRSGQRSPHLRACLVIAHGLTPLSVDQQVVRQTWFLHCGPTDVWALRPRLTTLCRRCLEKTHDTRHQATYPASQAATCPVLIPPLGRPHVGLRHEMSGTLRAGQLITSGRAVWPLWCQRHAGPFGPMSTHRLGFDDRGSWPHDHYGQHRCRWGPDTALVIAYKRMTQTSS